MPKNLLLCPLMDIYGKLLTEKQRSALEYYYFDDLSLSEIAENVGCTRQAAQELIKRAEHELEKAEDILRLYSNGKKRSQLLKELKISIKNNDSRKAEQLISALESLE